MTGEQLLQVLFTQKGLTQQAFADYLGLKKQSVRSYFLSKKINVEMLRKYAQWQGLNELEVITFALGPAPSREDNILREKEVEYERNNPKLTKAEKDGTDIEAFNNLNSDAMVMNVIYEMIVSQKEQNAALLKLANSTEILAVAARVNALTIAKLSGITDKQIQDYKEKDNV